MPNRRAFQSNSVHKYLQHTALHSGYIEIFSLAFVDSDRTKARLCILFVVVQIRCAKEMGYIFCIKKSFMHGNRDSE